MSEFLAVYHQVSTSYDRTIEWLHRHAFLHESVKFLNHLVPGSWVEVVLGESVANLSPPALAADELLVNLVVSYDVHVVPPLVEEVVHPLLIHAHLDHAVDWEVEGVGSCLLYTSPSPRDLSTSRMPSSA